MVELGIGIIVLSAGPGAATMRCPTAPTTPANIMRRTAETRNDRVFAIGLEDRLQLLNRGAGVALISFELRFMGPN